VAELVRVGELIAGPRRVVTLWRPAGIGKTRVAMALARADPQSCFVALVGCRTGDEVAAEVVGALGLDPGSDPVATVAAGLAALEQPWLVLDNAEQVVGPLAQAVLPGNARRTFQALRVRSLVRRLGPGVFGLDEGIAAYALEQLGLDQREAAVRAAHRDHFLDGGSPDARARAGQALGLQRTGNLDDARAAFEQALGGAASPGLEGRILKDLGVFHHQQRELEQALARYEQAGDAAGVGVIRGNLDPERPVLRVESVI
jgi:predicted ATPase